MFYPGKLEEPVEDVYQEEHMYQKEHMYEDMSHHIDQ
jgi:hypothetical protein